MVEKKQNTFIFKALTQKAEDLLPQMARATKGVKIEVIDEKSIKFIFRSKLMARFITVDSFHVICKKFGLDPTDYEVTQCH